jgi:KTSC domain
MRAGPPILLLVPIMLFVMFGADNAFARATCVAIKYRDTPVCLDTFVCTETPRSSFVRQICYDAAKSYMLIKLNETWYHYCSVDRASIDGLVHASSVGTYYNQHFRSQGPVHGPFDCRDNPVPHYP